MYENGSISNVLYRERTNMHVSSLESAIVLVLLYDYNTFLKGNLWSSSTC